MYANKWDLLILGPNDSVNTQTIWHAAALLVSEGKLNNMLIIDWPTYPIVCCGYHQVIENIVDINYCKENNIPITRRAAGGGAVLLDSNQLFYNFIWHNDTPDIPRNISKIYEYFLQPVVKSYQDLGIKARYSPVNDILVENKKISGNGAGQFEFAQALVGNFILDFPREEMVKILKVPDEKFRDKVYKTLQDSISSFKDELGSIPERDEIISVFTSNIETLLGINLRILYMPDILKYKMDELKKKYESDEWIYQVKKRGEKLINAVKIHGSLNVSQGMYKSQGGLIRILADFNDSKIIDLLITGDFWFIPKEKIQLLEKELVNMDIETDNLEFLIEEFIKREKCELPGTKPEDIVKAIEIAHKNQK